MSRSRAPSPRGAECARARPAGTRGGSAPAGRRIGRGSLRRSHPIPVARAQEPARCGRRTAVELAGVEIAAPDVAPYELLLGVTPAPLAGGGSRFALERGTVDLVQGEGGLRALRFVGDAPDGDGFYGLPVVLGSPT